MACLETLKGIARSCKNNLAGIKSVVIGDFDALSVGTVASGVVSEVSLEDGAKWYRYDFAKQTGSLTSTLTKDETNGTNYYTNVVALQFNRMEADKHLEIEALAKGQVAIIVLDNNDKYWLVGDDNYASATEATAQTGASYDDLNGYNTSLQAMSIHLPYEVAKATAEAIFKGAEQPADA